MVLQASRTLVWGHCTALASAPACPTSSLAPCCRDFAVTLALELPGEEERGAIRYHQRGSARAARWSRTQRRASDALRVVIWTSQQRGAANHEFTNVGSAGGRRQASAEDLFLVLVGTCARGVARFGPRLAPSLEPWRY